LQKQTSKPRFLFFIDCLGEYSVSDSDLAKAVSSSETEDETQTLLGGST
jgi:hypothetical protein